MTIAVTGAGGFIGTHLMHALAASGEALVAVGRRKPSMLPDGVRFVEIDLAAATIDDYDRIGRPEMLCHLAWDGLPNYRSLHHFEDQLPLHYRFLKNMVEGGLGSIMVTGTCFEYGMIDGELREDALTLPGNPYAFAKCALLRQLQFLKEQRYFDLTWARLFYMHGTGQAETSILPLLNAAIQRGDRSFPMSGGEQLRDYLTVEEVARQLAGLARLRIDAGIVNVSSGVPVSIRKLVEGRVEKAGSSIELDFGVYGYPNYEPFAFWGSAAKRKALLAIDERAVRDAAPVDAREP